MQINVRLFGGLHRYAEGKTDIVLEVSRSSSLADLIAIMALPEKEIWFIAVNGEKKSLDYQIKSSDIVDIFAPVGGG